MRNINFLKLLSLRKSILFLLPCFLILILAFSKADDNNKRNNSGNPNLNENASFSFSELSNFENLQDCLQGSVIKSFGCEPIGVDQATLTVRSDGTADFWVHYCCNKKPSTCSNSSKRLPTTPGSTKHAEWSINTQTGCLQLKVRQTY